MKKLNNNLSLALLLEFGIHPPGFDRRYSNDETGRWAYDPKTLLKIVPIGYSQVLVACSGEIIEKVLQDCDKEILGEIG